MLLALSVVFLAFTPPDTPDGGGCEYLHTATYDMVETRTYEVDASNKAALNDLDKVKLGQTEKRKRITERRGLAGSMTRTVEILNPEEIYPEWRTRIGKMDISKDGTIMYDTRGRQVRDVRADEEERADYERMEEDMAGQPLYADYRDAWASIKASDLEAAGYDVVTHDNGIIEAREEGLSLFYDVANRITGAREVDPATGEVTSMELTEYMEHEGRNVPKRTVETHWETSPSSGACFKVTLVREYSNYSLFSCNRHSSARVANSLPEGRFTVYPNPANETLQLSFQLSLDSEVSIAIYDRMGQQVASPVEHQSYPAGKHSTQVDIRSLTPGLYQAVLLGAGQPVTRPFVKERD